MKNLLTSLLFLLLFSSISFSQFTIHDRDLVKTTFSRSFDREIILDYLNSPDSKKVNAALLSIGQSGDTLFNRDIMKLDFGKYSEYICFALEEAGPSESASEYLMSELDKKKNYSELADRILTALGKTGDQKSYDKITRLYLNGKGNYFKSISISLLSFYNRKIGNPNLSLEILFNELQKYRNDPKRYFEAAFTIERIGVPYRNIHFITDELENLFPKGSFSGGNSPYLASAVSCMLKTLSKAKFFPYNPELKSALLNSKNFDIKVEAARAISFYNFSNLNDFIDYLKLLDNRNANIADVFAESLKNIKVNKYLTDFLNGFMQKGISNRRYNVDVRGELFLSYISLFKPAFEEVFDKFSNKVPKEYLYSACLQYKNSPAALNYLVQHFNASPVKDKAVILAAILQFQKYYNSDKGLISIIEKALGSDSAPIISIAADGIDSSFIKTPGLDLQKIILSQVKEYIDSSGYYESLVSLAELAKRIDVVFYKTIVDELSKSDIYSVLKYADSGLLLKSDSLKMDTVKFNSFWVNSFKYKGAVIKTSKGTFRIKFLPQYAPVTVGNFCLLSKNNFFKLNEFHRVVPGFVIQGGDPTATGWGGPGYDIVSEFSPLEFNTGTAGMASAGKDTEGSQWFITTGNYPHLNGKYTIFGKIEEGQNIVNETQQGDRIISVNLY